ncbi:sodium- and chloride-dependent glycine transporter 1-like isoform X2 [Ostrea edulis]|uniref:sodium- and chloride-dependent glycine transporter 1-like isoform X2 n=1 Tax=Ostrea edulis TaxID=37623 RepID=UPI0024AF5209|nr:sodium- and chloride-dependent glycine transporter 1-like isoform X2 [Ostrea edulis]
MSLAFEMLENHEDIRLHRMKEIPDGDDLSQRSTESNESIGDDRAQWGGKLEFLLTCVGYAVGLGNVWRFPYLCYRNGGGAFLIPYTIMLALVGLPLFYLEVAIGQYASLGPISIWRINPLFKGLGYAMVIVSWLIGLYYNVIIAHVLYYLGASFTSELPWTSCNNEWNTPFCREYDYSSNKIIGNNTQNSTLGNYTLTANVTPLHHSLITTPSEEYYNRRVLGKTSSLNEIGSVQPYLALTLLAAWLIVYLTLLKGIQSLGKVVYFTAIFPYVMLIILMFRGVTLPGAADGIIYYLKPDFQKLLEPRVWSDACTQIFYSLSACSGGLIAMSSYNKFKNNCYRDALIVCVINCGTSVFAGFVIFSILGFMAQEKNVPVSEVAQGGPGLAFIVYPEALSRLPIAPMWAVLFFIMMATLGFGSEFSIMECVFSALTDVFPQIQPRKANIIFRTIFTALCFLLGLPMVCEGGIYLLNLVDFSVGGFPLLVVGLFELLAISWIYGFNRFSDNIYAMLGTKPTKYWELCWKYISLLVIGITVLMNIIMYAEPDLDGQTYPEWAKSLGWLIALFPIIVIPLWFLAKYCTDGGWKLLRNGVKPLPSWGPSEANKKFEYRDSGVTYRSDRSAFAKLMSSNISNMTTNTTLSDFPFSSSNALGNPDTV